MKNPNVESLYRRMRQYHQHQLWPPKYTCTTSNLGIQGLLHYGLDFQFIYNRRRIEVAWFHPRVLYEDAISSFASQQAGTPAKTASDDPFIKVYKKVGRSRKKVDCYSVPDTFFQDPDPDYSNRLNLLEDQYMAEGIDATVSASFAITPSHKGLMVDLSAPLEIRYTEDLLKLSLLVKRLLKRETTLQDEFPDYQYTKANWVQDVALRELEASEIAELSKAESITFAEVLLDPPEPNDALNRAATQHRLIRSE